MSSSIIMFHRDVDLISSCFIYSQPIQGLSRQAEELPSVPLGSLELEELRSTANALLECTRCRNFIRCFPTSRAVRHYAVIVDSQEAMKPWPRGRKPERLTASQVLSSLLFGPAPNHGSVLTSRPRSRAICDSAISAPLGIAAKTCLAGWFCVAGAGSRVRRVKRLDFVALPGPVKTGTKSHFLCAETNRVACVGKRATGLKNAWGPCQCHRHVYVLLRSLLFSSLLFSSLLFSSLLTSCFVVSCHATACLLFACRMLCRVVSCNYMSCHIMSFLLVSRFVVSLFAASCQAML